MALQTAPDDKCCALQSIVHVLDSISRSDLHPLVLVDELATSTSSTDGAAIAWAVAEELIASRACTVFATHFVELTQLSHAYAPAFTSHMASEDRDKEYVLTYQCVPGPCTDTQYGLKMASKAAIPTPVVQHAILLASKMHQQGTLSFQAEAKVAHQGEVMNLLHTMLLKAILKQDIDVTNSSSEEALLEGIAKSACQ